MLQIPNLVVVCLFVCLFVFLLFLFLVYNQVLSVRVGRSGGHQRHALVVHSTSYDLHLIFQEKELKMRDPFIDTREKNVLSSHKVWPGSAFSKDRRLNESHVGLKKQLSILHENRFHFSDKIKCIVPPTGYHGNHLSVTKTVASSRSGDRQTVYWSRFNKRFISELKSASFVCAAMFFRSNENI